METTIYSLLNVLWWNLTGQYMYYLHFSLSLSPFWTRMLLPRFWTGPPQWWLDSGYRPEQWTANLTSGIPNHYFASYYRSAARARFQDWIENAADRIATPLVNVVATLLGYLYHGYPTFSAWLIAIRGRVGAWVPSWADHLAHAAVRLFDWLPSDITAGVVSFYDKFVAWYEVTKSWARVQYDTARNWVANIAPWLIAGYSTVRTWYDLVSTWVTNFKNNPYGTVAGFLGYAWTALEGMYWDLSVFMNTVWVPFKITLHDFLADPPGWMYDKVEDELCRRW